MRFKLSLFFAILTIFSGLTAYSQLKSPEDFLGYKLGERFSWHHDVVDYMHHVAEEVPHLKLQQYGETYEHRPLYLLFISSKENMGRLEAIRLNNLRRTRGEATDPALDGIGIVWISYNVHGNESCTMEAALKVTHELAAATSEQVNRWLENTLVIIDPCINPDGRDRYAAFYNQHRNASPNPDYQSMEHHEPWPGGRPNHYLFDLNRDWAWQKQIESRSRLAVYTEWLPHVHADFHEQGMDSPYYFAPAAEPYHEIVTDWQREFQYQVGRTTAANFDGRAELYFTREWFDLLYPSYGDTYPSYHGAIGMTYEQGGSGAAGLLVSTKTGATLSLKDRLENHYHSSMCLIETASAHAERLVAEFAKYYERNRKDPWGAHKSYVMPLAENDPGKLKMLCEFLELHKIEYGSLNAAKKQSAWSYSERMNVSRSFEKGDLVISAFQRNSSMLQVLFDPNPELSDSLTYDITTWAMPYAFGLEAYALNTRLDPAGSFEIRQSEAPAADASTYAWLANYSNLNDLKFLSAILQKGVKVRVADTAFRMEDKDYARGTLAILRADNPGFSGLDQLIRQAATKTGTTISTSKTGFASTGYDLGSDHVKFVAAPSVAILAGEQVSSLAFGECWYFFEQELGYPATVLDADDLSYWKLEDYSVIIAPEGYYNVFNEEMRNDLLHWVRDGGVFIATGSALSSFADQQGFALKRYQDDEEKKVRTEQREDDEEKDRLEPYENRLRNSIRHDAPGAVWDVKMDASHPLAFGYKSSYFSLKNSPSRYAMLPDGWNVGYLGANASPVSGFSGSRATRDLSNSLVFGVQDAGRGHIVYMVDNPLFRAFWENGKLLIGNAVFLVGAR